MGGRSVVNIIACKVFLSLTHESKDTPSDGRVNCKKKSSNGIFYCRCSCLKGITSWFFLRHLKILFILSNYYNLNRKNGKKAQFDVNLALSDQVRLHLLMIFSLGSMRLFSVFWFGIGC